MKVKIDINRTDYWNFNKYGMLKIPTLRRNMILNMIALPVLVLIGLLLLKSLLELPILGIVIFTIIGGGIGDLLLLYIMKRQIMKIPNDKAGILGEHIIEINEEGVRETTSVSDAFQTWEGIYSIDQNEKYIFIFLDNILAHIIPKRSFNAIEEADEFYNNAINYWKSKNE